MKKIHLIAAAAALLLSGGVFMKTYQVTNINIDELIETVSAGADPTNSGPDNPYAMPEEKGWGSRETCTVYVCKVNGNWVWSSHPYPATYPWTPQNGQQIWCHPNLQDYCTPVLCHLTIAGVNEF